MNSGYEDVITEYIEWLDYPYQLHLTTLLSKQYDNSQSANRDFTHTYLAPISKHIGATLCGLSVVNIVNPPHVHSLLFPKNLEALNIEELDYYCLDFGLNGISRVCVARPIYPETLHYVFSHLTDRDRHGKQRQLGFLHLHNLKLPT